MLQRLFRRYDPPYFLTSVYDNSARESMARFFLRSLPTFVMTEGISKEMILQAVEVLYPMINKLEPLVQDDVENSILEQDLSESAQEFGIASAKRITKQWQEFLLESDQDQTPKMQNTLNLRLEVEPTGHFEVEFQCPIPKEKWVPELCAITHGLFSGLGKQFGYFHVEMLQTMIRDKSSACRFSISD